MKKLLIIYTLLIGTFLIYYQLYQSREDSTSPFVQMEEGIRGEINENYVMVTFQTGIEYWKGILKGFEDAAQALNVSVEYRGSTEYDAQEQVIILEQIIAKKPAGIALTVINAEALTPTINKAIEAGIPVVLFDAGAPESKAFSLLATNNYNAGISAAHKMGELIGGKGEVAIITLPNQLNHQQRTSGFQDVLANEFPDIQVVAIEDGRGDQVLTRQVALEIMAKHPTIKGIFSTFANGGVGVGEAVWINQKVGDVKIIAFDTDKGTLDMVNDGIISATMAQGTWNMGYWSLLYLFHLKHGLLQSPMDGFSDMGSLPPHVDTGISIVTKENVELYYAR